MGREERALRKEWSIELQRSDPALCMQVDQTAAALAEMPAVFIQACERFGGPPGLIGTAGFPCPPTTHDPSPAAAATVLRPHPSPRPGPRRSDLHQRKLVERPGENTEPEAA
jgi:hypothetical protein